MTVVQDKIADWGTIADPDIAGVESKAEIEDTTEDLDKTAGQDRIEAPDKAGLGWMDFLAQAKAPIQAKGPSPAKIADLESLAVQPPGSFRVHCSLDW